MARKLGISSQLYGYYERGEKVPGSTFFVKWQNAFGENLVSLLSETKVSVGVAYTQKAAPDSPSIKSEPHAAKSIELDYIDHLKKEVEKLNERLSDAFSLLKESLTGISVNLDSGLVSQKAGQGLIVELLLRAVHQEAGGNPDKEAQILDEISGRTGLDLMIPEIKGTTKREDIRGKA